MRPIPLLQFLFCLPLLLAGCDRSNSITKEKASPHLTETPPAPAASTQDSGVSTDAQRKEPKPSDAAEAPSKKPIEHGDHEPAETGNDPAQEPSPTKKSAPAPETVIVRGKEYPYCRTPSEEGCILRERPTEPPVWK